jgi:hypothetical protein
MFYATLQVTGAVLIVHPCAFQSETECLLRGAWTTSGERFTAPSDCLHLVWGRVVPDIPDFCRELVAGLAEQ